MERRSRAEKNALGTAPAVMQRKKMADAVEIAVKAHDQVEQARKNTSGGHDTRACRADRSDRESTAIGTRNGRRPRNGTRRRARYEEHFRVRSGVGHDDGSAPVRSRQGARRVPVLQLPLVPSRRTWRHLPSVEAASIRGSVNDRTAAPTRRSTRATSRRTSRANPHVDVAVRGEGEVDHGRVLDALAGVSRRRARRPVGAPRRGRALLPRRRPDRPHAPSASASPISTSSRRRTSPAVRRPTARPAVTLADHRDQPRLPVRLHVLRLGLGHPVPHPEVRPRRVFAELEWCAKHDIDRDLPRRRELRHLRADVEIAEKVAELKHQYGYPKLFGTNYAKNTVKHLSRSSRRWPTPGILTEGLLSLQSMDDGHADTDQPLEHQAREVRGPGERVPRAPAAAVRRPDAGPPGRDAGVVPRRPPGVHRPRGARPRSSRPSCWSTAR